ncbi:MAG: alanine--tRNA ligase [Cytophagales bacterium]|nr:alanine--tRNA ligase [Bernardetiaceae bacterium]MDW8204597.1 alanine--tRNA ligase [Cytophagales bacterium]
MTANEIRQQFLDFFIKKCGHAYVHSAPMVLKNDPTLMFSNSGMVQFKDYFLGNRTAEHKRVANSQKCLRVSGKHNDLEDVGLDTYHHTMFEMLGNWSFGDYFKKEAIQWAWELLTEVYRLPKDRLYVTVFGGDQKEGLARDEEAYQLWQQHIDPSRILYGSKKDNFWEMGDQGPCGPCSEIHIDLRPDAERAQITGYDLVNQDHPQVIEIWNLVFMQFNRKADGSLEPLPDRHVDTGMGFERLVRAIQGKVSNYDTDIFQPIIRQLEQDSGKNYHQAEKENSKVAVAMRVVADHLRAVTFAIADGQLPSNNKAGYVIRRILRRAVRYGYTFLGFRKPFICHLVPLLAEQFASIFPEVKAQSDFIINVIREEEAAFLRTLENGLRMLDSIIAQSANAKIIDGKIAFELYDTYGFPLDLTALIAREHGLLVDEAGFDKAMQEQKERSRNAAASEKSDWVVLEASEEPTEFVGYETDEAQARLLRYRAISDKKGTQYQIVLDRTPFYAESGGQVGDTGLLIVHGEHPRKIRITDTKKEIDQIIHFTYDNLPEILANTAHAPTVTAMIDSSRRRLIECNHSATHLMHAALREVLGKHVVQKGSLVNDEMLRFDFSHFAKMTDAEIEQVEKIVNAKIRANIALEEQRNVPIEKAKAMGAMALFGEKYGDFVRVITFDKNFSVELCGGTHVPQTGVIGQFKIVSESSSAAGVRRIEAITAAKAEEKINQELALLNSVRNLLKNPKDLLKAVENLMEEKQALQKELEHLHNQALQSVKQQLLKQVADKNGIQFIATRVEVTKPEALKTLAFQLKQAIDNLFAVLTAEIDGKVHIAVMIAETLVKERNWNASQIVKELAKLVEGGGGGQPFFATAAGKNTANLSAVLSAAEQLVNQ